MSCPFEIKYLSVTWSDENSVRSITESRSTLPIVEVSSTEYEVDAITYSKIDDTRELGQIAFHIIDHVDGNSSPEIIYGENSKPLLKIVDEDTKKVWWIEEGEWKKIKDQAGKTVKYRDSPICRHAGKVEIAYEGVQCFIRIRSSSFTYNELEKYLADFKIGLWGLILDDKSYVTAERNRPSIKIANEELLSLLNQFINYSENIIQAPKKELRESQSLQSADNVRPSSRTFMDIALKGMSAKELTGRDYTESYDISENQYVYGLVGKIYTLVAYILDSHNKQNDYIDSEDKRAKKRIDSFVDTIEIDKGLALQELREIQGKKSKEVDSLIKAVDEQELVEEHPSYILGFIKITGEGSIFNGKKSFWGRCKKLEQDEWGNELFSFRFDPEFSKALNINGSYSISACAKTSDDKVTKAGKKFVEIDFKNSDHKDDKRSTKNKSSQISILTGSADLHELRIGI